MLDLLDDDGHVGRDVGLGVLAVVDLEVEGVPALGGAVLHGDDAGVLVEAEGGVAGLAALPGEGLVRQVPVVAVVDVNAADLGARGLAL